MKLSRRARIWVRILLILLSIRLLFGVILIYFVTYRFNDVVQLILDKESNNRFYFHAVSADISLWHRTIALTDAKLLSRDSSRYANRYSLTLPAMYFSLHSVMDLLINRHVTVDSLLFDSPVTDVHLNDTSTTDHSSFQPSQLTEVLKTIALHLRVRALRIQNASFVFHRPEWTEPFTCSNIDFYIKNFSAKSGDRDDLLSSEDVDLTISKQNWQLPETGQQLSFSKLHFSGVSQFFELDSPDFRSPSLQGKAGYEFSANRVFFNSSRLQDLYENEKLFIDTLICYKPLVKIESGGKHIDTARTLTLKNLNFVFKELRIGYIEVNNGQLVINQRNNLKNAYLAQQANLKIFNLHIQKTDSITTNVDSVQLALNDLKFLSKDSLYQMSIRLFTIHDNDVILSGADYGPTEYNKSKQLLFFKTSFLHIRDVNFEDLLQKKLTGRYAELYHPEISILNNNKVQKVSQPSASKLNNFYRTLHELNDLINVDSFQLIKANLNYHADASNTHLYMHTLDATVLLNKFLASDSLIDIKRSLPKLSVAELRVKSPKTEVVLNNYVFNGTNRSNRAERLRFTMTDNTNIVAKKLYWEVLDWDLFENHRIIQFDVLHIGQLFVRSNGKNDSSKRVKKDLPVIHIGRLDVDSLYFANIRSRNDSLVFTIRNLCLDDIHTKKQFFLWGNMQAWLTGFRTVNPGAGLSIGQTYISNEAPIELKSIQYKTEKSSGHVEINIPSASVSLKLHSSDFSHLQIDSVNLDNPSFVISNKKSGPSNESKFALPFQFETKKLSILNGSFQMKIENAKDSLFARGHISIRVNNFKSFAEGEHILGYESVKISLADMEFTKTNISVFVPQMDFLLTNGRLGNSGKLFLSTAVTGKWSGIEIDLHGKDSSFLSVKRLSGGFSDGSLSTKQITTGDLIAHTTISNGSINYSGGNWLFNANSFSWKPERKQMEISGFSFKPRYDKQQYYKIKKWQTDYIEVTGKSIRLNMTKIVANPGDTLVKIKRVILDSIELTTSRDKRMEFQHGIIKQMPTVLIENIPFPFGIDTVEVINSRVIVRETALKTGKEGVIMIGDLNAHLMGINNDKKNESLHIRATASVFGTHINNFRYTERYHDSLSNFSMSYQVYPVTLTDLNTVTVPLTSVSVKSGNLDTLFTSWTGNKYAAIGSMNFYYQDLSIKILDPLDPQHSNLKLMLVNILANTILLRGKNSKPSVAYFVRDREKFIFNYWVKTTLGGIISSVGFAKDSKYLKEYNTKRETFSLPPYKSK